MKYMLKCVVCNSTFPSFEKYEKHVVKTHTDRLGLRMKPKIVRVD